MNEWIGYSLEELEALWRKKRDELLELRKEIDRRKGDGLLELRKEIDRRKGDGLKGVEVDFTKYVTK